MNEIYLEEINQAILNGQLASATLSNPLIQSPILKIAIRAVMLKNQQIYQITEHTKEQAFHQNKNAQEVLNFFKNKNSHFKQIIFSTRLHDYHLLRNKKGTLTILKKNSPKSSLLPIHNREKNYLLSENEPIPFLIHVGIMNKEGKIYPQKRDKFRQINRFLEMIQDILPHLDNSRPLTVIDFGCGKAYLTFALYHFLVVMHGLRVNMTGLDLKQEVIKDCQQLTKQLGYQKNLNFLLGDINTFEHLEKVDLVVSLHACDTATDAAIEKAIKWKTDVILSVPCCQHELYNQIKNPVLKPLLKHGILKEKFASLVTDAVRAQLLEILGYQTQIIEFIDLSHTPKNLLIRAIRNKNKEMQTSQIMEYQKFKEFLSIDHSLERRFKDELPF